MDRIAEETTAQVLIGWLSGQLAWKDLDWRSHVLDGKRRAVQPLSLELVVTTPHHMRQMELELQKILTIVYQSWDTDDQLPWPRRRLKALLPPVVAYDPDADASWFELILACHSAEALVRSEDAPGLEPKTHTLVLKGGGIKGLAYIGALEVLYRHFRFDRFVGTSAGAIVATLLAAGYQPDELKRELFELDFSRFLDAPWWKKAWNLWLYRGMNSGRQLSDWMDRKLAEKLQSPTPVQLSDLPFRATLFACQRGRDVVRFDSWDNDRLASHAVRCSMSLPGIYMPPQENGTRTYDGGLRHNFPLQPLLDEGGQENRIGLFLGASIYQPHDEKPEWAELLDIWTGAGEYEMLRKYRDEIVMIDPSPIRTLDFELSEPEKKFLVLCGKLGALRFVAPDSQETERVQAEYEQLKSTIQRRVSERVQAELRSRRWLLALGGMAILTLGIVFSALTALGLVRLFFQ